jgi:hypothetical protein
MAEYIFSTIIPIGNNLSFKEEMKEALTDYMGQITASVKQDIQDVKLTDMYSGLNIKIGITLNREDDSLIQDLAGKIDEEILNPIRMKIISSMENKGEGTVDYKTVQSIFAKVIWERC